MAEPAQIIKVLSRDEYDDIVVDVRRAARRATLIPTLTDGGARVTVEDVALMDIDNVLVDAVGVHAGNVSALQVEKLKWEHVEHFAQEMLAVIAQ